MLEPGGCFGEQRVLDTPPPQGVCEGERTKNLIAFSEAKMIQDDLYMGEMVLSFDVCILFNESQPMRPSERTCGIYIVSIGGKASVIKLSKKILTELVTNLRSYLKTSDAEKFYSDYWGHIELLNNNIASLPDHPLTVFQKNKPKIPEEAMRIPGNYVSFIHVNEYQDLYRIDCTLREPETKRFSFAASVIPIFSGYLEDVLSQIN